MLGIVGFSRNSNLLFGTVDLVLITKIETSTKKSVWLRSDGASGSYRILGLTCKKQQLRLDPLSSRSLT